MQGYPPGTSSVPREFLLNGINCDLLSDAVVLTPDSFLAVINFPFLPTGGTSLHHHPLWLKVLFCQGPGTASMSAFTSTFTMFLDAELSLCATVFHLTKSIGGVFFRFAPDTTSVEGLPSSTSCFLFPDLSSLSVSLETIMDQVASFFWTSSPACSVPLPQSLYSPSSLKYIKMLALILVSSFIFSYFSE